MGLGRALFIGMILVAASWYAWLSENWVFLVSILGVGILIGIFIGRHNKKVVYVPVYKR